MRSCVICEESFEPQYNSLQKTCDTPCAIIYARNKESDKKSKITRAAVNRLNKRDIRYQHRLTQKVFNRLRVLQELKWFRDKGLEPTCISCGKPNMDWCCGHYKTVKGRPDLRYSRLNTYLQCNFYCNCSLSGNLVEYTEGLLAYYGEEHGREILLSLEVCHDKEWTAETLEAFRLKCRKEIRELERVIA